MLKKQILLLIVLLGLVLVASGFEAEDITDQEAPPPAAEEAAAAEEKKETTETKQDSEGTGTPADEEDDGPREKAPKYEKRPPTEYDMERLGWGSTDQEVYNDYGVILNYVDDFMQEIVENDILSLFYLFDSNKLSNAQDMTTMMHRQVITPVFRELKGLAKFYVFDCQHPKIKNKAGTKLEKDFRHCEQEGSPPALTLFRSPDMRKNPYTGEVMKKSQIPFPQGNIDQSILKKWISTNMPDFTHVISSKFDYDTLIKNPKDLDINKVILFSKKAKVTPVFKALSAEFRDKIRFNLIHIDEKKPSDDIKQILESYDVTKLPAIVIEQTYNAQEDETMDLVNVVKHDTVSSQLKDLVSMLRKYARKIQKEETEESDAAKENQREKEFAKQSDPRGKDVIDGPLVVNATNFWQDILESSEACVVYFTTLAADVDVMTEYKHFSSLERALKGAIKVGIFRMDPAADDFSQLKKEYKAGSLAAGKPVIRFYPNEVKGELKNQASFGILFDATQKENAKIMEEIQGSFEHNVREVQGHMFNNLILQHAKEEQKNIIYYMYDDTDISLTFKAVSKHPILQEDCVFWALHDPDVKYFQGLDKANLPSIGVLKKLGEDFTEGEIQQSNIGGKNNFYTILGHIAKSLGKMDELEDHLGLKQQREKVVNRVFGEIRSNQDFQDKCLAHGKGCAIGLLSALTIQDYEKENTDEHLAILAELDAAAPGTMFYSWVNVTCHPEWLKYLDVDPFQIPSMTYYYPGRGLQSNHIGKFDKPSISDSADRFGGGKLANWKSKFTPEQMTMEQKDCSLPIDASSGDDAQSEADRLLEEEIMREIMEEEAARQKAQDAEDSKRKNVKGSKGKKKKGKKKGKKASQKDEL